MTGRGAAQVLSTLTGAGAAIGITLVLAVAVYAPNADRIAAVFPPWWPDARMFQAAGRAGRIVGVGRFRAILIVEGERAGLAGRLRDAGALFMIEADAGGCRGPRLKEKT